MPKNTEKNKPEDEEDKSKEKPNETRAKVDRLCACDRIVSMSDVPNFCDISKFIKDEKDLILDVDECNDDVEAEYLKLSHILDLPQETHSLTKIETHLPSCLKYGFHSGLTHMMQKYSPLPRTFRGPAIAIAAIATSVLVKPHCWNEPVIDQVIEDGESYCNSSYKKIEIDDRRTLTALDLKRHLYIRKTHRVTVKIDDPIYAGTFRSENPKKLHVAKALDLFFKKYNAGVLTSPVLNIAIWKVSKYFNIFDGQARLENCDIADGDEEGTSKLILVQNLPGVLFIILEKSKVQNEPFVIYGITVADARKISDYPSEEDENLPEPQRRPSGYRIQEEFRAVVQGSYHLQHSILPAEFQGRGHLIIAVATLVYSKLLSASKWTKVMIDLIFNQSNIFLTDLVRVLGKELNENFELMVKDLFCDVVFGVYTAKIKVEENVIPGQGKKGKITFDSGVRDYFATHTSGIIEIKKVFYPIWKEKNKFYFLDPFGCDIEGFRVDATDPEQQERYKKAAACITMNSSVNELMEIILENTESKDKDPFIIHGLSVLYIKTGTAKDGSDEKIVFREKKTNRRPERPPSPESIVDECTHVMDTLPQPRFESQMPMDEMVQYPEMMDRIEIFVNTFSEEDLEETFEETPISEYKILNPHRLMLKGTRNCVNGCFDEKYQGRQGLVIAIGILAQAKVVNPADWTCIEIDKIIREGNITYGKIVSWIHRGSPADAFEEDEEPNFIKEMENQKKALDKQYSTQNVTEDPETSSQKSDIKGLNHLSLTMMPKMVKIADLIVHLAHKINVIEGEASPLANLGEALERYFELYDDVILENRKLMYAIWKKDNKYFIFNSYGCDNEGWRNTAHCSALIVVDSIFELINVLYGFLEYNEYYFTLHYIKIIVQQNELIETEQPPVVEVPDIKRFERYKTKFLPLTEDDLNELTAKAESTLNCDGFVENAEEMHTEEEENMSCSISLDLNEALENLFKPIEEPSQSDPPMRLNLALITGIVKIENKSEDEEYQKDLEIFYEKLKYAHPPPFVTPPEKNLCDLLDIKLASKSMHSLLSRFSIDSKLAIKEKPEVPESNEDATVSLHDKFAKSKLIKLPPKKYFLSKSLPNGLTPIRAVNEIFIRCKIIEAQEEEECRRKKLQGKIEMVSETVPDPTQKILPSIIPLGPYIATPEPKIRNVTCPEKKKEDCPLTAKEKEDAILKKLVCSTENLLLELIFPIESCCETQKPCDILNADDFVQEKPKVIKEPPDTCGFQKTDDDNVGIITANTGLEDRETIEKEYYKTCYFSAIFCILAKININVKEFRSEYLDRFIAASNKISDGAGKLRIKMIRWFRNFHILGIKYHVILRQIRYADPENFKPDELREVLLCFFQKHQTGIIVFSNVAYAFWSANDVYYLFDPYPCDENGRATVGGNACLMQICDFDTFAMRMMENTGEWAEKPYRLYSVAIAHLEPKTKRKRKKKKTCKQKRLEEEIAEECEEPKQVESEVSLIELTDWVNNDKTEIPPVDTMIPGFSPIKNYSASAMEVFILENEITRPNQAPFEYNDPEDENSNNRPPKRTTPYDRVFFDNVVLAEPMDLCIMAWAQIYEPRIWSTRTIQALFAACKEYTQDSILASEDSSIPQLVDGMLNEFNIANYSFRVAFAPTHQGVLYAKTGWNLAMSLEKIFDSPIYTGAVLVCSTAHIGVMQKENKYYAWWYLKWTKNIRFIVSDDMEDYLKLLVKEINQPDETCYCMRIVTISYAKMLGPNCSDIEGLHESMMPSSSLAAIHRKGVDDYNLDDVFQPTDKTQAPIFVHGTVALNDRDEVTEPKVKRCYFVALFAIALKRDIIQNPLPGMIDKVLELGDVTYNLFREPKFHTEHILKDVSLMERVFEFRDCSSQLVSLLDANHNISKSVATTVRKHLKQFFKKYTSGILQFSNCCYGFWYSEATNCYYYLDPYQCNCEGRRVKTKGNSCLFIFTSICEMTSQMCLNQYKLTTGFFVHRVHVESVNSIPRDKFLEDPIWIYLDYHWSYRHIGKLNKQKNKKTKGKDQIEAQEVKKPTWKNYLIEVPNMIYSVWGSISAYDGRFGGHAGKNQAAICVTAFAMRNLCHPSEWSTVVLDSAVICGDCFYKESKKTPACNCFNRFGLLECLKVPPYLWTLEFRTDICGILYGSKDQLNLAECIEYAFTKSPNLLVQCKKKIIAVLQTRDAYYAVDSAWTGPPLFSKDHGAIYAIRCKNTNTLVYIITKMMNTNQRIEFTITPVIVVFRQETCQSSDAKPKLNRKKILQKPVYTKPGQILNHPSLVTGSEVVPDEDSYLCYSRNLKLGLAHGEEYEKASKLVTCKDKKSTGAVCKKSTKKSPQKQCELVLNLKADLKFGESLPRIMTKKVSYAKLVDFYEGVKEPFIVHKLPPPLPAEVCKVKEECEPKKVVEEPLEIKSSFIVDKTRAVFDLYNCEMAKEVYKHYRHLTASERRLAKMKGDDKEKDNESTTQTVSLKKSKSTLTVGGSSVGEDSYDGEEYI